MPGTILGVALEVTVPVGEYHEEKLINLGTNRWTFRPQIGVVHSWGKWAAELTGSAFFFTDNDDFYQNTAREQDPLLALQGHLIYTFRAGNVGVAEFRLRCRCPVDYRWGQDRRQER